MNEEYLVEDEYEVIVSIEDLRRITMLRYLKTQMRSILRLFTLLDKP